MWTPAMKSFMTRLVYRLHGELESEGYPIKPIRAIKFSRAINTYGMCTNHSNGTITITISEIAFSGGNEVIKNTALHELIHGFKNTKGHDATWYRYAREIGAKYGVNITQYVTKEEIIACKEYKESRYNWSITCPACGHVARYFRKSKVIDSVLTGHNVRCSCGHRGNDFKVESLKKGMKIYSI